jgi:hypothetical protein
VAFGFESEGQPRRSPRRANGWVYSSNKPARSELIRI